VAVAASALSEEDEMAAQEAALADECDVATVSTVVVIPAQQDSSIDYWERLEYSPSAVQLLKSMDTWDDAWRGWYGQQGAHKHMEELTRAARRVASMQLSSAMSEFTFSLSGALLSARRLKLDPVYVQWLMFIRVNEHRLRENDDAGWVNQVKELSIKEVAALAESMKTPSKEEEEVDREQRSFVESVVKDQRSQRRLTDMFAAAQTDDLGDLEQDDNSPVVLEEVELIPAFDDDDDEDDGQGAVLGNCSSEEEEPAGESEKGGEEDHSALTLSASGRPLRKRVVPLALRGTRVWRDDEPLGI